jgi:hypothetical protein
MFRNGQLCAWPFANKNSLPPSDFCAIRRAEIGNYLATFTSQWTLADQLLAQGNGPLAQRVRDDASKGALAAANRALDALVVRVKDSAALVNDINSSM